MRFFPLLLAGAVSAALAADADLILHNGKVVTVDAQFSIRQAVAVKAGRITAVGTDRDVLAAERGPATRLVDLQGRTVLPGLIDSHVHALRAGLSELRRPLPHFTSYADVQQWLRDQAKVTPKGQWIRVPLTFPTRLAEMRMPTREVLDVVPDHPVVFDASYVVVVNSKALEVCGITKATPNPPGGEILHDSRGEPTGVLRNAQSLLKGLAAEAPISRADQLAALEAMLRRYVAAGLTSVVDRASVPDEVALYRTLHQQKRLPLRVTLTWRPDGSRPVDDLVREIRSGPLQPDAGDGWLRVSIFKVTLDGGMTIGTAYQREPYGAETRNLYAQPDATARGQLFIDQQKLTAILQAARDQGWQLTSHSQGGGAIDILLNSFDALNRQKPLAPTRSHLMHASFQSPEAIRKAKQTGVLADVQAAWLYNDIPALSRYLPASLLRNYFPLRSYREAGVLFAGGSDHMIGHDKNRATNPYNPFLGLWTSVTRKTSEGKVFLPDERISREDALRSYTVWAAHLQREEDKKGSLEVGKMADMVVIDRDYLTCPEDEIGRIEPVMVILEGKPTANP